MNPTHHVFIAGGGGIGRALALMLLDEPSFSCRVTIGDASVTTAGAAAAFAAACGRRRTSYTRTRMCPALAQADKQASADGGALLM